MFQTSRSAANFSFEELSFPTKNSQTDFPVHFQKEKAFISHGSFCKPLCISETGQRNKKFSLSIASIANMLRGQGMVLYLKSY